MPFVAVTAVSPSRSITARLLILPVIMAMLYSGNCSIHLLISSSVWCLVSYSLNCIAGMCLVPLATGITLKPNCQYSFAYFANIFLLQICAPRTGAWAGGGVK